MERRTFDGTARNSPPGEPRDAECGLKGRTEKSHDWLGRGAEGAATFGELTVWVVQDNLAFQDAYPKGTGGDDHYFALAELCVQTHLMLDACRKVRSDIA